METRLMLSYLFELRRRAMYILIWFGVLFVLFFFIAGDLYHALVSPLLRTLSPSQGLIATQITSPVFIPLQLAADAALLLSTPFALYQLWCFMRPALYKGEQQQLRGAFVISLCLFIIGALFCFYLVLPSMFQLFIHALPKDVHFMPDMAYAFDFIMRMLMLFGLCFQVPLICLVLVRLHILDALTLKNMRPYVIVGAFIIGMLLTPPDVVSQIMLALPLCLLYEVGIVLAIYLA